MDHCVPQDHIIRKIHDILDLSYPYYAHDGKPSIDPVVLFKLSIIGYFFGIPSERRIVSANFPPSPRD
jgi:transposase